MTSYLDIATGVAAGLPDDAVPPPFTLRPVARFEVPDSALSEEPLALLDEDGVSPDMQPPAPKLWLPKAEVTERPHSSEVPVSGSMSRPPETSSAPPEATQKPGFSAQPAIGEARGQRRSLPLSSVPPSAQDAAEVVPAPPEPTPAKESVARVRAPVADLAKEGTADRPAPMAQGKEAADRPPPERQPADEPVGEAPLPAATQPSPGAVASVPEGVRISIGRIDLHVVQAAAPASTPPPAPAPAAAAPPPIPSPAPTAAPSFPGTQGFALHAGLRRGRLR